MAQNTTPAKASAEVGSGKISKTVFTFTVLHPTDCPMGDLGEALYQASEGHAVGLEDWVSTQTVPDSEVIDELVTLGNDGTFFNFELGLDDEYDDEDDVCRVCGAQYAVGGDGWDGMCPSCADKDAASDED